MCIAYVYEYVHELVHELVHVVVYEYVLELVHVVVDLRTSSALVMYRYNRITLAKINACTNHAIHSVFHLCIPTLYSVEV